MKKILLIVFLFQMANAQNLLQDVKFIFGYNRANLVPNEEFPEKDFGKINHYYNSNFNFGLMTEIYPTYHIGVLYVKRGTKEKQNIDGTLYFEDGDELYIEMDGDNVHIMNYLSLIGFKSLKITEQIFLLVGMNVDLYLSGEIKTKTETYALYYDYDSDSFDSNTETESETIDFSDMYLKEPNEIDFGGQIGLGFNLTKNFQAQVIYQLGITEAHEISYEESNYKNGWKHKGIQFQLIVSL